MILIDPGGELLPIRFERLSPAAPSRLQRPARIAHDSLHQRGRRYRRPRAPLKKKELIGDFKPAGRSWCLEPIAVNIHDSRATAWVSCALWHLRRPEQPRCGLRWQVGRHARVLPSTPLLAGGKSRDEQPTRQRRNCRCWLMPVAATAVGHGCGTSASRRAVRIGWDSRPPCVTFRRAPANRVRSNTVCSASQWPVVS
jgi:hypothetical protein